MGEVKTVVQSNRQVRVWPVVGRALVWSVVVGVLAAVVCGVLGVYGLCDQIPVLGDLAKSNQVIGVSVVLAILTTWGAATAFFEEAGVLLGFIILSTSGFFVVLACVWFGANAFNFFRSAIAGGILVPALSFPLTCWLVRGAGD